MGFFFVKIEFFIRATLQPSLSPITLEIEHLYALTRTIEIKKLWPKGVATCFRTLCVHTYSKLGQTSTQDHASLK